MARPRPLPEHLRETPFLAREALRLGVTPRRLRNPAFAASFWGVRSAGALTTTAARCSALALRLGPAVFFSHTTAALLHGIPVPLRFELADELHASVGAPHRAPHAAGIIGHRLHIEPADLRMNQGLQVTSVERTWCDLATLLTVPELVAAGDFLIHHPYPATTRARLQDAVAGRASARGHRKLVRALSLLDEASESPPESLLRVILVEGGAPPLRINRVVTDRFGEFVARTDIEIEEWNLLLEYQGDYHRTTKGQWRADMTRRSRMEATGRRVMELNADDLRDPVELMARIRARAARP